jgi:hypothetical protein
MSHTLCTTPVLIISYDRPTGAGRTILFGVWGQTLRRSCFLEVKSNFRDRISWHVESLDFKDYTAILAILARS